MSDCLFCKIIAKEIPSKQAYEDDQVLAFYDIEPQAPVHILIVPKKHVESVLFLQDEDKDLAFHMLQVAKKLANDLGLAENGFRLVFNTGADGGQTVMHLHLHLLGGRAMGWPPG